MSKSFKCVKNQVLLGNFDTDDLLVFIERKIITDDKRLDLLPYIK